MIQTQNFQPVKYPANRFSTGGKLAVLATRGMIANVKPGAVDEIELCTGKAGFFLTRDVVSEEDAKAFVNADELNPNKGGFESPAVIGYPSQVEDLLMVWVEGPALLDASMDAAVVGGNVTTAAGKLTLWTVATQEVQGVIRDKIAGVNGVGPRFLIEMIKAPVLP